jgi:hypothetical protein
VAAILSSRRLSSSRRGHECSATGFAYALGNAMFGGTAEYVALALNGRGYEPTYAAA